MVYVVGIIGFILGFIAGQALLLVLLKDLPKKDMLHNKNIHWKYGLLNWGIAVTGSCCFVFFYQMYLA